MNKLSAGILMKGNAANMKKYKYSWKRWLVLIVLAIFLFWAIWEVMLYYIAWKQWKGIFVRYDEKLISSNENYIGVIDSESKKVFIMNHNGVQVSNVDTKETYPDQIALGTDSYFLLYQWEDEDGSGKIVQYDYQSNKLKECKVPDVATITYKDKYLFVGNWKHDGEDKYYYFQPYYDGFYANKYIEEENFGNPLQELSSTKGICLVGSTKMYYHEEGFFSTEPVWWDYPGTSIGEFTAQDEECDNQVETGQEKENHTRLLKKIGHIDGVQNPTYCVREYQSGNEIYGVCNILKNNIPSWPIESEDVIKSCCYKISREKNEIRIIDEAESCIAIIAKEEMGIYQKDNFIIRRNFKTGVEESIYEFEDTYSKNVFVCGDYLLVKDKNNNIPVNWNMEER